MDHCVGVAVAHLIHTTAAAAAAGGGEGEQEEEAAVSKDLVRQRLADVSSCHPEARPSRGTLKQVYNYLFADQLRRLGLRT